MDVIEARRSLFMQLLAKVRYEIDELYQIGEEEPHNAGALEYAQRLEVLAKEMVLDSRLKDESDFAIRAHRWGTTFLDIQEMVDNKFPDSPHARMKAAFETAITKTAAELAAVPS